MAIVRIVSGTYGHRPDGSNYVVPVTPRDLPISVSDEEAKRLVDLGVAVYVDKGAVATPPAGVSNDALISNPPSEEDGENGDSDPAEVTGNLDPEALKDWKMDELRKLADDMGIDTAGIKKKDALIEAIAACEVSAPALNVEDVIE